MNKQHKIIQLLIRITLILSIMVVPNLGTAWGQDTDEEPVKKEKNLKPVRSTFESALLIDNQTVMVSQKNTFEWDMQHRFGVMNNGYEEFAGLYAPANIRMGFTYTPIDNLAVGFGFTKNNVLWDFSAKYALFQQARQGGMPVSIAAYTNMAVDTRNEDNFINETDRYSYFYEIIIARKINKLISLQVAPNLSHFNAISEDMENDHLGVSFGGRVKLGETSSSAIFEVDQAITTHSLNNPHPNLSFGYEVATSGHAFQVFVGNYKSIINQYNNVFNTNDYEDGDFLIGFNITRLWNF